MIKVSKSERNFIIEGVKENIRSDGRTKLDYRTITLETAIVQQSNGSARVKLANTDVLVGIKVEIGSPDINFPDQGRIEVRVECSPSASPEFEGKGGESLSTSLSHFFKNLLYKGSSIDWKSLCIAEGKQCWIFFVDCLVLDSQGNLFDALSIGIKSALQTTKIPKIEVTKHENGEVDIEIEEEFEKFSCPNIPLCITFAKLGSDFIVDPTVQEELCMSSRLTVAINPEGDICSIQKGGVSNGINPSEVSKMLQFSKKLGIKLNEQIQQHIKMDEKSTKLGFFA